MTARNGHSRNGKPAVKRKAPARKVRESVSQSDIVSQLAELNQLLSRREDMWAYGSVGTTQHFRKSGRNYPFFQNEMELANLRASSRILWGMSSYARGLFEGIESYVFGDGLTYAVSPKKGVDPAFGAIVARAAQQVVDQHLSRNQWLGGEQPGLESEFFRRSRRDGEVILCHTGNDDGTCDERFIEPDQLRKPAKWSDEEGSFGIRTPANDVSRHEGYWISPDYDPEHGEEYTPDEITHFRCNVDRNVKRGLPDLVLDCYDSLNSAALLRNALGEGAAEQASIASVMEHENATGDQVSSLVSNEADYQLTDAITGLLESIKRYKRGTNLHIPKGQRYVEAPSAANAGNHIAVLDMLLRSAGRPWNAPEWLTSGDASNNNYASSLTAESPFVRRVKREQRGYCEALGSAIRFALRHACTVVGLTVNGRVLKWQEVNSLIEVKVTAPSPETRDKLQEAQRDQVYVGLGAKSPQLCAEEQGYDFERVQRDRDEFKAANPDMGGNALTMDDEPKLNLNAGGGNQMVPADLRRESVEPAAPSVAINLENLLMTIPENFAEIIREAFTRRQQLPEGFVEAMAANRAVPLELLEAIRDSKRIPDGMLDGIREAIEADRERPIIVKNVVNPTPINIENNVTAKPGEVTVVVERSPSRVSIEADRDGNIKGATITPQ